MKTFLVSIIAAQLVLDIATGHPGAAAADVVALVLAVYLVRSAA